MFLDAQSGLVKAMAAQLPSLIKVVLLGTVPHRIDVIMPLTQSSIRKLALAMSRRSSWHVANHKCINLFASD